MILICYVSHREITSYTRLAYIQMAVFYVFSTGLALAFPEERGTVSLIAVPILSTALIDRLDRLAAFNAVFTVFYSVCIFYFKNERLVAYEIFSIVISFIIALISHDTVQTGVMRGMMNDLKNEELIAQLNLTKNELQVKSERDGLSGLFNRETLVRLVENALQQQKSGLSALCIIDLDDFKSVNDTYGHQQGDAVLMTAAAILQGQFRASDVVGRIGGDEFMIFLNGISNQEQLKQRIDMLHETLNAAAVAEVAAIPTSIGISVASNEQRGFELLYRQADQALYFAKRSGRNRVCFFEDITPEYAADT